MKRILRSRVGVLVTSGLIMLACAGMYWTYLNQSHDQMEIPAIQAGEASAEQLAYAMAEHTTATIRQIDFALRGLSQYYLDRPDDFTHAVESAVQSFPALVNVQVTIAGEDGIVRYSSAPTWKPESVTDREYFRHLSTTDTDDVFVGHPVVGRFTGKWYLQFARRLEKNGTFAGIIVLSVDPGYISQVLRGLKLGPNDSAGLLLASDGTYLARNVGIEHLLGKQVKSDRPYLLSGAADQGVFIDNATYEPVRRIFAWRRLHNLPLVVFVGLAEQNILEPVKKARFNSLMHNGILLGILIPAGLALTFLWHHVAVSRQRVAESEALYRSLFEYNISIKLIMDPSDGRIVAANPAACQFYGYSRDQMVGMNISQINCLPEGELKQSMEQAKTGQKGYFLFSHRLASGEIRQVEVYSGDVKIDGRDLLYSIVHDITEQRILASRLEDSETRYRTLFKAIPEGAIIARSDGAIIEWNEAALSILQVDEEGLKARSSVLYRPTGERLPKDQYPTIRAIACETCSDLYIVETVSGERRWIYANSCRLPPMGRSGEISAVVIFSDMTHVVALEESALISKSVFDVTTEALLVTSPDSHVIQVNPAFQELTGYSHEDVVGRSIWSFAPDLFPAQMETEIIECLEVRKSWSGELLVHCKNGNSFTGAVRVSAVYSHDGRLLRYVGLFSDVTDRKRQEKEMWTQANFDALTGLPNRTLLNDRIRQALAQTERRNLVVGVLFMDLDRFKPVNDTYGHAAGDLLLKDVAQRLQACVRAGDTVARVGGDEFVILLPMIENVQIPQTIAKRILDAMNTPFHIEGSIVQISASIGVTCSNGGEQVEDILKAADDAMYQAKKSGRSKILMAQARTGVHLH